MKAKRIVVAVSAVLVGATAGIVAVGTGGPGGDRPVGARLPAGASGSLGFILNAGQAPEWVRFHLNGSGARVGLGVGGSASVVLEPSAGEPFVVGLEPVDASAVEPIGSGLSPTTVSFLSGPRETWEMGLPTYAEVRYAQLWPGIDLDYGSGSGRFKYTVRLAPGADPAAVRFELHGATAATVDEAGRLRIATPAGPVIDEAPIAWQDVDGRRVAVEVAYDLAGTAYGFRLGAYDPSAPLVIDPDVFVSAGYIGGDGFDKANGLSVAEDGSIYLAGETESSEATFPDGGGFGGLTALDDTYGGDTDGFVAKVAANGNSVDWVTYLGGDAFDIATGVAATPGGDALVVGRTASDESTFPVTVGPDLTYNGGAFDAFVAGVAADGLSLVYAGYVGGNDDDYGEGVAAGSDGAAYLAGYTQSDETTFPDGDGIGQIASFDGTFNLNQDAFAVKVAPGGASFTYAGYVGGQLADSGYGIAVTPGGQAYLVGDASSSQATFPDGDGFGALGGVDHTYNGGTKDGFIAKIAAIGTSLSWASYMGGDLGDHPRDVDVGGSSSPVVAGYTESTGATFPDGNGFGALPSFDNTYNGGSDDGFALRFGSGGAGLYGGFIGGDDVELLNTVVVDRFGYAHVAGTTDSTESTFPDGNGLGALATLDGTANGGSDGFVVKLGLLGTSFRSATFVGGAGADGIGGIDEAPSDEIVVGGSAASDEATFPDGDGIGGINSIDDTQNGSYDAHVVELPPRCPGFEAVPGNHILGTNAAETLNGTPDADVICGLGGVDTIDAGGGDDLILGGAGADVIDGEGGADTILGGLHGDDLTGGGAGDTILGGLGTDDIFGGDEADFLDGGPGGDHIEGQDEPDELRGGGGPDELDGGNDDDVLRSVDGVAGNDDLDGGTGAADTCTSDAGDAETRCEL